MGFERDNIKRMHGYLPGKQPEGADVVKLNTNENPYPPCAAVMSALRGIDPESLRRYPPPLAHRLRAAAASIHGLEPENVVAVNGGDELLRLAITTFVEPGLPLGMVQPSYSLYPVLADIHGSPMIRVHACEDWSLPPDFIERMNVEGVRLLFVVNPHAPSGSLLTASDIAGLAQAFRGVLLVDEAYVDFVDPELDHDLVPLLRRFQNLLLLRTLSKGYSLAGLRVGYGLGAESLIAPLLLKTRDSYNVDAVAQIAALAALQSRSEAQRTWQQIREQRELLRRALLDLGFQVCPSQSNFVLASALDPVVNAGEIHRSLEQRGIYVRYFSEERLQDALRITVGTSQQNQRLLDALQQILQR